MIADFRRVLLQNAGEWNVADAADWRVLLSNNYQPNYSTIALFWFRGRSSFPSVVTKIFHEDGIPRREFESLREVHAAAPTMVPRPLHFGRVGGFWSVWMEGVPGRHLRAQRDGSFRGLAGAVDALKAVHRGIGAKQPAPDRRSRLVLQPLAAVEKFGDAESVRSGCRQLAARCSEEWIGSLAAVPQHGDFSLNNVLCHKQDMRVLDWESYGNIDLPCYDLVTFLISVLQTKGWTPQCWTPSVCREVPALLRRYARGLDWDLPDISQSLPLVLANWFHLHLADGRQEFAVRAYQSLRDLFEHPEAWEGVFLGN